MGESTARRRGTHPAAILVILVLAAVAAPVSLNKVSPIAPYLMQAFAIGETQMSLLISVLPLTGIALALPGGFLIRRHGPWKCMLAALLLLLGGSVMGELTVGFALLVASRVVEGAGMALVAIAGPAVIAETAGPKIRGFAMGLFAAYMGIGQVLIYNLAPRILPLNGWHGVWRFSTLYTAAAIALWVALMIRAGVFTRSVERTAPEATPGPARGAMRSAAIWALAASLGLYVISYVSIQMFLPTWFNAQRGMALAQASSLVSVCCFMGTISSLAAGRVSDVTRSRRVLGGVSLIAGAALFLLIPAVPAPLYLPFIIVLGIIPPVLPVCVYAAAAEAIEDPAQGGVAMGILSLGQNAGMAVGPLLFGGITEVFGWNAAFIAMVPVAVAGGVVMLLNRRVR